MRRTAVIAMVVSGMVATGCTTNPTPSEEKAEATPYTYPLADPVLIAAHEQATAKRAADEAAREYQRKMYVAAIYAATLVEHEKRMYVAALYAAALEQAKYNERQRRRVESAVRHYSNTPEPEHSSDTSSSGRCGGDLPPCSVMMRESGGNIRAENPSSSASGKWQFLDGTWNGYGGYSHAADAPESVQDARAREVWAGGAGCGHWAPTNGCG